ncbi:ATP-dependent helicase [Salmonella enterica subsp. enterica serovar Saintpaul]|nr:ATP-dependent helicase [Salmonella enterica subsp. enterica serovar Saintpaul]
MEFFNFSPSVEKVGSYYVITGINLNAFELDLRANFGTSVIFNRMIIKLNNRKFKIHQFFMVELAWILDHFTTNRNKRQVDRYRVGMYKYNQLYNEIKQKTWIESTFQDYPPYPVDKALRAFNFTPFPDQRIFLEDYSRIKYGYQLRGCLLDAEPGSGKTYTSLVWSEMISPYKTIVIVPKHLVQTPWKSAIENEYFKTGRKCWTTLDGTDPMNHTDAQYFIIHKDTLRQREYDGLISVISKQGKEPIKVIIDESHNYNEHKSQQTQGLIDICSNKFVSDVLFMSGTPIKAQGRETFALFTVIDKFFDKDVQNDFLKMYGRDNEFLNQMLAHRLGRIKFTINKVDGMGKPPEPVIIPISFPGAEKYTLENIRSVMMDFIEERVAFYNKMMPQYVNDWKKFVEAYRSWVATDESETAKLQMYIDIVDYFQKHGYNNFTDSDKSKFAHEVEKNIERELKGDDLKYFRHIKSAVKYVGLKIRGEALGRILSRARMEAVRDIIEHADLPRMISAVEKKTAIYTSYIDVIKELEDYFSREGINSISVSGENSSEIEKVIDQVSNDPGTNPLITTFNTLREGYPLLMCNQIIMMNSPFRSYETKQTIARIYRKGQDAKCYVYLLDLDTGSAENITSRSIDIMEWSKEQVDILLGGGKLPKVAGGANLKAVGLPTDLKSIIGFEDYGLDTEHFDHHVYFKLNRVSDLF